MEPTPDPVNSPTPPIQPPVPTPPQPAPIPPTPPQPPAPMPAAPSPLPKVMVGDGGLSPTPPAGGPVIPPTPQDAGRRRIPKKLWIPVLAIVLVLTGAAIWYFGYFTNPSVVYKQSLKNTGKGYDKLVDYVDKQQQQVDSSGYTGDGTYKIKVGDYSTDGKIALKGDGDNGELTFDVGLAATRVNADVRTFKSSGTTPDIYVKASDIKGLGTVIGVPQLDAGLAKLDNNWIVIDHTLLDNIGGAAGAQAEASSMNSPTRAQVLDEARAFGKVNQDYLFSTDKNKAVTKVVTSYGKETVNGHKTYHYKVALQPANVKKYIEAQSDALKSSSLNSWLQDNKYDKSIYASFDNAAKSTKDIKTTDTYDVWMDASQRIVYKVRFSEKKNPATNYVDVGLNYQNKDVFPFFISGMSKTASDTTAYSFVTTLNTTTGVTNFTLNLKATGSDPGTVSANFNFKPSTAQVKITKPTGAVPLSQVLSELGLTNLVNQYTDAAAAAASSASSSATTTQ